MNKTPEDEAFEAIEKAQGWRKRQIADAIDDDVMCCRNDVLEEVALALEAFHIPFGQDTINSFATFVRDMKHEKTPEQESVIDKSAAVRIATSLGWEPKRTWVGLTDDEFKQIMLDTYNIDLNVPGHSSDDHFLWRAIEAKLKEKNNG